MYAKLSTGLAKACPVMPFHICSECGKLEKKTQLTWDHVWRMADDSWLHALPFLFGKAKTWRAKRRKNHSETKPILFLTLATSPSLSLLTTTLGKVFSEHSGCSHCTPDSDALRAATAPLYTLQICLMRTEVPRISEARVKDCRTSDF